MPLKLEKVEQKRAIFLDFMDSPSYTLKKMAFKQMAGNHITQWSGSNSERVKM